MLQGPLSEQVEVLHVMKGVPVRVDAHTSISMAVGYMAVNYEHNERADWDHVFRSTNDWVLDMLVQSLFPGPTWLAASDVRGTRDPFPPFVESRHKVIQGTAFYSYVPRCRSLLCSIYDFRTAYYRLIWNAYVEAYDLGPDAEFDATINVGDREFKAIVDRVSDGIDATGMFKVTHTVTRYSRSLVYASERSWSSSPPSGLKSTTRTCT